MARPYGPDDAVRDQRPGEVRTFAALRVHQPELPVLSPLGRLVPWVPRLLGIHLGVALLALAATGAFLVVVPPGPDAHGAAHPSRAQLRWALLWLRLGVGTALIVLAFSEKLTNPAMATDTLEHFPQLDVFGLVGIHLSPETFNATLLLFGQPEMVGHLPVYGVFLALLVYGSSVETAREVRWLPGRDVRRSAGPAAATA